VAVLERPKDTEQILSLVNSGSKLISKLGVLCLDIDEKVSPLLPPLRRLSGVLVAVLSVDPAGPFEALYPGDVIYSINDAKTGNLAELEAALGNTERGASVAVQVERLGQLQYLLIEIQ
jgi:S1-C subfamily serine protease